MINRNNISILAGLLAIGLIKNQKNKSAGSKSSIVEKIDKTISITFPITFVVTEDSFIENRVEDINNSYDPEDINDEAEEGLLLEISEVVEEGFDILSESIREYVEDMNFLLETLHKNNLTLSDAFEMERNNNYLRQIVDFGITTSNNSIISLIDEHLYNTEEPEYVFDYWEFQTSVIEKIDVKSIDMIEQDITRGLIDLKGVFTVHLNVKNFLEKKAGAYHGHSRMYDSIHHVIASIVENCFYDFKGYNHNIDEAFIDGEIQYGPMSKMTSMIFGKSISELRRF